MHLVGPIIVIIVVIAVVTAALMYPRWRATKRRNEMAALAARLGWSFDPEMSSPHEAQYAHFDFFFSDDGCAAYNTLTCTVTVTGRILPVKMGDFTCTTKLPSGKGRQTITHVFSYLLLRIPLPEAHSELLIRREGVADKVADACGFPDIDFESAEFSRTFHVKCRDKRFAYDLLHPRMMEFLLGEPPPGLNIAKGYLCISDGRSTWGPRVFIALLPWIGEFFDLWPKHLVENVHEKQDLS